MITAQMSKVTEAVAAAPAAATSSFSNVAKPRFRGRMYTAPSAGPSLMKIVKMARQTATPMKAAEAAPAGVLGYASSGKHNASMRIVLAMVRHSSIATISYRFCGEIDARDR